MTLLEKIRAYKEPIYLQQEYLQYIANKEIPLEDRWNVFAEAPYEWKHHCSYIEHFDVEEKLQNGSICWYDDFFIDRYQTVNLADFVEDLRGDNYDSEERWPEELISEFMEEVLDKNLGSFVNDW